MAQLHSKDLDAAIELCRQASEWIEEHGTFRMRVVVQMLLIELKKDRAAGTAASGGRGPDEAHDEAQPGAGSAADDGTL